MAEHTPGPWQPCGHNRGLCECRQVWSTKADVIVAVALMAHDEGYTGGQGVAEYDEAKANAKLIAAAPKMLDVLEFIRDADPKGKEIAIDEFAYDRMVENYRDAARQAIEEATA